MYKERKDVPVRDEMIERVVMKSISLLLLSLFIVTSCSQPKLDPNYIRVEDNLSIEDFLTMVTKVTGNEIIREEKIDGQINFIAHNPILKSELIPLVNAVVDRKEMTLIKIGKHKYKVVKPSSVIVCTFEDIFPKDERPVTVVYLLDKLDEKMVQRKIKPLLSKNAKVVYSELKNTLTVTASSKSLNLITMLIDKLK